MALPYDAILPRKLQELESRLTHMFHHPTEVAAAVEPAEAAPVVAALSDDDIGRRFEFLKNLLSAEMESHPEEKPEHLYHIAERLAFLEVAYDDWAKLGTCPAEEALDNLSVCSCTYSCFNEADDEEWMEPPNSEPAPAEPEPAEPIISPRVEEDVRVVVGKGPALGKKVWTVFVLGLVGAAAAVGLAVTNLVESEQKILLVPT